MKWTPERQARLTAMWNQGLSGGVIAERFGCSRSAIMGQVNKLGLKREKLTAEQTKEAFAECLSDGMSVADAARSLGITKTYGFNVFASIRADLGWQAR